MAKTQKKASIHSRSARRAASPSIDTDKSLKEIRPPPSSTNHRPAVLAIHQGAGVSKKSKNGRKSVLSAKAKARQEKVLDRAEAVMDQKAKKIEKSKGRARNVQDRAETWEQRNKRIEDARLEAEALQKVRAAILGEESGEDDEEDDMEVENEEGIVETGATQASKGDAKMSGSELGSSSVSAPLGSAAVVEDEEEVL